jgi:HSP20 family protein
MLSPFFDFSDSLRLMDSLERKIHASAQGRDESGAWMFLRDTGEDLVLLADLPGFEEKDIDITLEGDVLTLRADAPRALPEGFKVVRSERSRVRLLKQIELPVRVDVEGVSASFTDGVLELKLPKAAEARPRRIPVTGTKTDSKEGASA